MRVVRLRPAAGIVDEGLGLERAVRKILQPAAAPLIAHEDVERSIRPESHDSAVVVPRRIVVVRSRVSGDWEVVGLQRAHFDDVSIEGERRAIPDEPIHTVAEERDVEDRIRVGSGAALSPSNVHPRRRRKVWMKDQTQETALRVGVDREIEHWRGLDDTRGHALHHARRLFEHEEVVLTQKDNPDRLADARTEHDADLEIRVEHLKRNTVRDDAGGQADACGTDGRDALCGNPHSEDLTFCVAHRASAIPRGPFSMRERFALLVGAYKDESSARLLTSVETPFDNRRDPRCWCSTVDDDRLRTDASTGSITAL